MTKMHKSLKLSEVKNISNIFIANELFRKLFVLKISEKVMQHFISFSGSRIS